jgi:hypothetical protein
MMNGVTIMPLPWLRDVASPLTEEMLAPMDPLGRVQFSRPLTRGDYAILAQWLSGYPKVILDGSLGVDGRKSPPR